MGLGVLMVAMPLFGWALVGIIVGLGGKASGGLGGLVWLTIVYLPGGTAMYVGGAILRIYGGRRVTRREQ